MKLIILYPGFKNHINSSALIFNRKTTYFLVHDVKYDIGNNSPIPKDLNYKFYSNYFAIIERFLLESLYLPSVC